MNGKEKIELTCTVIEFSGDPSSIVPLDKSVVEQITKGDGDPEFVTIEVESGWSKNKRLWPSEVLLDIARQVREKHPVGFMGHIKNEDDPYTAPPPETIWLGASTQVENGKMKLFVKGYNIPGGEIKDRGLVRIGAVNSTSWRGDAELEPTKGGYKVAKFDLETIDWSRKGKEGMLARVAAVTSEMEENRVEPRDIAALSEADLRIHNPLLVQALENAAAKPLQEKVSEMETAAAAAQTDADLLKSIREKLGIDENTDVLASVVSVVEKVENLASKAVKGVFDETLAKKVPNEKARSIVRRLVGEMEGDPADIDEFKTTAESKIDEILENDEDVKAIVAEMSRDTGGRKVTSAGSSDNGKSSSEDKNLEIVEVEY